MAKLLQIRHVPDEVHRTLKVRAAQAGKSLSDYALEELRRSAAQPTLEEIRERLAALPPVRPRISPARMLREERDRRGRMLDEARDRR